MIAPAKGCEHFAQKGGTNPSRRFGAGRAKTLVRADGAGARDTERRIKETNESAERVAGARAFSCFTQRRISIQLARAIISGTTPTSKSFPIQGRARAARRAALPKAPLAKIQPECSPIDNQSERVCRRASARMQPITKSVRNPAASRSGSPNCPKECAIETKPDDQRDGVVRRGQVGRFQKMNDREKSRGDQEGAQP